MRSTKEKAELCRALHAGAEPTLSAACWDVGTAYLLAHVGVPLIDTTSFGAMATRGLPDAVGLATRDFMLGNARLIAAAVDLPVHADLENGFGDSPEIVAQTITEAGATGIVGGSIEDATLPGKFWVGVSVQRMRTRNGKILEIYTTHPRLQNRMETVTSTTMCPRVRGEKVDFCVRGKMRRQGDLP